MINVNHLMKTGLNMVSDNAPVLLTAFGAVGVVGTAVLTAKASFEAAQKITDAEFVNKQEHGFDAEPLTKTERVKLVWPLYIGAVSSGVFSCGAIVLSHRISSRRAAMLAAAYALNEGKLQEYQDQVKEKFGIKKEKELRDDVSQKRIDADYDATEVIFSPTDGKVLMREEYTGRFFWSSIDAVNKAVNEVNASINTEGSVRLSDFYDLLSLEHVSTSDYFGWTSNDRLEVDWNTGVTPDGKTAVHTFEYVNHPVMNPEREADFR